MVVLLVGLLVREHTFLFGMGFFHTAITDALTKDDTHKEEQENRDDKKQRFFLQNPH